MLKEKGLKLPIIKKHRPSKIN